MGVCDRNKIFERIARKNPALQDSPPAADRFCDILPFRRSAILLEGLFHITGDSIGFSYDMKKSCRI